MKWLHYALAIGLTAVVSTAMAFNVIFVNKSSWEIHEVYFSPANERNWGEDYLDDEILEKGDSLTLTGVEKGRWDVRLVDEDGDECVVENVYLDGKDRWVITDKDLLGCQAAS